MSTLDVTGLKSKVALTPTKFYDKDDVEIGTLCRAWVNFDGTSVTGDQCHIRANFNVDGVTRNGTGIYTINFTNAMPDANYAFSGQAENGGSGNISVSYRTGQSYTTTALTIVTSSGNAISNREYVSIVIFR